MAISEIVENVDRELTQVRSHFGAAGLDAALLQGLVEAVEELKKEAGTVSKEDSTSNSVSGSPYGTGQNPASTGTAQRQ